MIRLPLLLLLLLAAVSAAADATDERVWIALQAPASRSVIRAPAGLVEVRGLAGTGTPAVHDLVLVIDVSDSTAFASGVDLDGDGKVGRANRRVYNYIVRGIGEPPHALLPEHYSSDTDDTILLAELAAARRLLDQLSPEITRLGLVTFREHASVRAPLSHDRTALRDALDQLERDAAWQTGGTNFAAALDAALDVLGPARAREDTLTQRTILFLSDGQPTVPRNVAEKRAIEAAERVAEADAHIHGFALGPAALDHYAVYRDMALASGGRMTPLERPGDVVHEIERVELAGIAHVSLENTTTGEPGRAVRVFPDGSFDGFVTLAPGPNRVRVTARAPGGTFASQDLELVFDEYTPTSRAEAERVNLELESLGEILKARSAEIAERRRLAQERAAARTERELALEVGAD